MKSNLQGFQLNNTDINEALSLEDSAAALNEDLDPDIIPEIVIAVIASFEMKGDGDDDLPPSASTDHISHTLPETDPRAEEKPTEVKKTMSTSLIGPSGRSLDPLAADAKTTSTGRPIGARGENIAAKGQDPYGTTITDVKSGSGTPAHDAVLTAAVVAEGKHPIPALSSKPESVDDGRKVTGTRNDAASSDVTATPTIAEKKYNNPVSNHLDYIGDKTIRLRTKEELDKMLAEEGAAAADARARAIISRIKDGYFYTKATEAEEAVTKYAPGTH